MKFFVRRQSLDSTATMSTEINTIGPIPQHIAIIMDGNGRWAKARFLPRFAGHKKGVDAVREVVRSCSELGVKYLTLFAFSSENWRRPADEVSLLMKLFIAVLEGEAEKMHQNGIRLKVVGDLSAFDADLQALIAQVEARTADNSKLTLSICANYGGRWDILQAVRKWLDVNPHALPAQLDEPSLAAHLSMAYAPEPDLFIRTGGEQRVSNFLLWQLAYTELYFTPTHWPEFDRTDLIAAIASFQQRERRFGQTSEQIKNLVTPV